MANNRLYC